MVTIHLTWDLPTTRVDGSALAASEISKLQIQESTPAGGAATVTDLPADATSFDTGDVSGVPGDYAFAVVVFDTQTVMQQSQAAVVTVNVPAQVLAAPSAVGNLTGTLVTT